MNKFYVSRVNPFNHIKPNFIRISVNKLFVKNSYMNELYSLTNSNKSELHD